MRFKLENMQKKKMLSLTWNFVSLPLIFQTLVHKDLCSILLPMVSKVNNLHYSLHKYTPLEYLNDVKYLLIFICHLLARQLLHAFMGFTNKRHTSSLPVSLSLADGHGSWDLTVVSDTHTLPQTCPLPSEPSGLYF